jgi:hypothetical protein
MALLALWASWPVIGQTFFVLNNEVRRNESKHRRTAVCYTSISSSRINLYFERVQFLKANDEFREMLRASLTGKELKPDTPLLQTALESWVV